MRCLLIGIHDVTPLYQSELDSFYEELQKRGIKDFTIFITPNWEGKYPVQEYPDFINKIKSLRDNGAELALHGYYHDKREFKKQGEKQFINRLQLSLSLFKNIFHLKPKGFLPCRWIINGRMQKILQDYGFKYTESLKRITYFDKNEFTGFPLGMESMVSNKYFKYDRISHHFSRIFSQIYARKVWNQEGVVRYAIHPREKLNGNFNATLKLLDKFLNKGWTPLTYSQLINRKI